MVKCLYVGCSRSLDILRQEIDWLRTEQRSLEFRQSSSGQSPIKLIPGQGHRSVNFTTVTYNCLKKPTNALLLRINYRLVSVTRVTIVRVI